MTKRLSMKKLRSFVFCLSLGCIEAPPDGPPLNPNNANNSETNNSETNNSETNNSETNNSETNNGLGLIGAPCESNQECATNLCLTPGVLGIPGGYCYAPCDAESRCPAGNHCALQDARGSGICVKSCEDRCERPDFGCFDFDLDLKEECWPRGDGPASVGEACTTTTQCAGGNGAICLDASVGYEGGYCTLRCVQHEDCDSQFCLDGFCLAETCNGREGYQDVQIAGKNGCLPSTTGSWEVGDACISRLDCSGGLQGTCLKLNLETSFCTLDCTDDDTLCGSDFCGQIPNDPEGRKICIERCAGPEDCINGLECVDVSPGVQLCLPPE